MRLLGKLRPLAVAAASTPGARPLYTPSGDGVNPDNTYGTLVDASSFEQDWDETLAIAWLHDIIEDGRKMDGTKVREDDLRGLGISEPVVADVLTLSQREGEDKPTYLNRVAEGSPRVKLVKVVDRICNLREGKDTFKVARWVRYITETQTYILPLVDGIEPCSLQTPLRTWLEDAIAQRPLPGTTQ